MKPSAPEAVRAMRNVAHLGMNARIAGECVYLWQSSPGCGVYVSIESVNAAENVGALVRGMMKGLGV
jgi:hypothetical protein